MDKKLALAVVGALESVQSAILLQGTQTLSMTKSLLHRMESIEKVISSLDPSSAVKFKGLAQVHRDTVAAMESIHEGVEHDLSIFRAAIEKMK